MTWLLRSFGLLGLITCTVAMGANPSGWRTDGTGRYPDANPPVEWSAEENVAWKTELPGPSYGSPVIVGERVFVVSDPAELLCLAASDGSVIWHATNDLAEVYGAAKAEEILAAHEALEQERRDAETAYKDVRKAEPDAEEKHDKLKEKLNAVKQRIKDMELETPLINKRGAGNTAGTPVTDGQYIYAVFAHGVVAKYTLDGQRQWVHFVEGSTIGFGHSSSPLLVGDRLIVHFNDLVALDANTGEEVWRIELPARHASPVATTIDGEDVVITPSGAIVGARDGHLYAEDLFRVSEATPIVEDDMLYVHQSGKVQAFRLPTGLSDMLELEVEWEAAAARDRRTPSAVLNDGLLYAVTTRGIMDVTNAEDGGTVYKKRLSIGNIYSSVTAAGDKIYIGSTKGDTIVIEAGPRYEEVARNSIDGYGSNPVFVGDRMYLRTKKYLYAIED